MRTSVACASLCSMIGRRPRRAVLNSFPGDETKSGVAAPARTGESLMFLRFALCIGVAVVAVAFAGAQPCWAQKPAPTPPASTAKPDAPPAAPAAPAPGAAAQPGDPFGEDTTLVGKPIVYVKGTGNWDSAFETIIGSLKTLKSYIDKEGLKADGQPMTIFTSTDDTGFQFQAAIPIAEPPKTPPHGNIAVGTSPEGHALKFVHRGSYDGLDNTYEAITNFLDERRLEAKDMFIEQYVTDPLSTNEDHLVVNVFVLVK
jgi:effector-binding domain-containing protein